MVSKQFNVNKQFLMEHPHPRLAHLLGYCIEGDQAYMVYEFMKAGSLQPFLDDPERLKKLTAKQRIQIALDIGVLFIYFFHLLFLVNILKFLHSNGITHLDINSDNIFLDEKNRILIGGCGFARIVDCNQTLTIHFNVELKRQNNTGWKILYRT